MKTILRAALLAVTFLSAGAANADTLTLEEAIRQSVANSPLGAAATARVEVLEAARAAADTKPAATIDGAVENIGTNGFNQFQIDATYNQRIERGGKRAARVALAEGDIGVAQAQGLIARLDLAQKVQQLYVEVQAATLDLELARSRVEIAEALQKDVQRRVDDARDPLFAGTRARTQLAEAKVDLELAEHAVEAAKARLALLTGQADKEFAVVTDAFLDFAPAGTVPDDLASIDLALYEARSRRADANIRLQAANARTDPTVFAGPRFLGTGDVALVGGFSLPLSNRALNQANRDRAEAEKRQIEADLAVERFERRRAIGFAVERVEETGHEAEAIRTKVVPGAE